jgi:general secretion pathway protein L
MNIDVARSLQPLRVRYVAPLTRRFEGFWSWWTGELRAMLPQSVREVIAGRKQNLFVEPHGDTLHVRMGAAEDNREILRLPPGEPDAANANIPRDVREAILLLPSDKVLTKALQLPLAAEENLREVLAFEMDQHTPFRASKVYYDFVVTDRSSSKQTMTVEIVFSPRAAMDELVESVSRHGIRVDIVTSRASDGAILRAVNLLPPERRRSRRKTIHRLNLALAATCVLLLAVAIMLPILQKNTAIRSLESQLEVAAAAAREGNNLRGDLKKMADASRFLAAKKQSDVLIVQVIDEISRIFPDDTWISRLDILTTEIQLQGQSSSSSSLIAIIESSDLFENARFRSPVVQIASTNVDRFHVSADVKGSGSQ